MGDASIIMGKHMHFALCKSKQKHKHAEDIKYITYPNTKANSTIKMFNNIDFLFQLEHLEIDSLQLEHQEIYFLLHLRNLENHLGTVAFCFYQGFWVSG